ncbi:hypothetical protein SARC_17558, partial [Sphaeroforma arctica JP610]
MSLTNPPVKEESSEATDEVEDDPQVDLTHGNRKVWLVKFTEEMYNAWVDSPPGTELGTMKLYTDS